GDKLRILPMVSLFELLEQAPARMPPQPRLLVLGGLDYGAVSKEQGAKDARTWQPLPETEGEAEAVRDRFLRTFPKGTAQLLEGQNAPKTELVRAVRNVHYLHIATHGYFAPEAQRGSRDVGRGRHLSPLAVRGLSPMVLTGLALSGANAQGEGVITAEEMQTLDLASCRLVVLSACDTSVGVGRAGQGYASLRTALVGAGARFVLTSLWMVGDKPTRELMQEFYARLWDQGMSPHQALWEAKKVMRSRGAAFRDWAGWVLTGQ
ncbi:MAG: CHAT domain-containing protein, partial [Planctomycetota bacterium]